jgi:hypothetical protein
MTAAALVLPHLLPREALECGSVVSNYKFPNQGKYKAKPGNQVLVSNLADFRDLQKHDSGASLAAVLSRLLKISAEASAGNDLSLATKKVITYELDDSDAAFAALCKDETFQAWFSGKVKRGSLYFVVGMQTVADAVLGLDSEQIRAAAAGLTVATPQPGLEVRAQASARSNNARDTQFTAENEQIYAVLYRKIHFDVFAAKDVSTAFLSTKQFWKGTLTRTADESYTILTLDGFAPTEPCDTIDTNGGFDVLVERGAGA